MAKASRSTFAYVFRRPSRFKADAAGNPVLDAQGHRIPVEYHPGYYLRTRWRKRETVRWAGCDRKTAHRLAAQTNGKMAREDLLGEKTVPAVSARDLAPLFEAFRKARQGERTVRGDRGRVAWIVEHLGDRALRDVTAGDVQAMLTALRGDGREAATVNRYLSVASLLFAFAIDRGAALSNPVKGIRRPKEDKPAVPYVSSGDVDRILAAETEAPFRALFRVLADTGLRRSEALALSWRDVDLARGALTVRKSKAHAPREVPLTLAARASLEGLRAERAAVPFAGPDPVFVGIRADTATNRLRRAAEAAGLRLRLHDLRHSCASRLAQAGVPLPTVGAILGHRCWQTTARYATHVPEGAAVEAVRKLDPVPPKAVAATEATGAAVGVA